MVEADQRLEQAHVRLHMHALVLSVNPCCITSQAGQCSLCTVPRDRALARASCSMISSSCMSAQRPGHGDWPMSHSHHSRCSQEGSEGEATHHTRCSHESSRRESRRTSVSWFPAM
jgi:hypothetical protein